MLHYRQTAALSPTPRHPDLPFNQRLYTRVLINPGGFATPDPDAARRHPRPGSSSTPEGSQRDDAGRRDCRRRGRPHQPRRVRNTSREIAGCHSCAGPHQPRRVRNRQPPGRSTTPSRCPHRPRRVRNRALVPMPGDRRAWVLINPGGFATRPDGRSPRGRGGSSSTPEGSQRAEAVAGGGVLGESSSTPEGSQPGTGAGDACSDPASSSTPEGSQRHPRRAAFTEDRVLINPGGFAT